jgi:hypothetical protein
MAEKLNESMQNRPITVKKDIEKEISLNDVQELKRLLAQMKVIEEQAGELISKFKIIK